jgi:hypothetical protein
MNIFLNYKKPHCSNCSTIQKNNKTIIPNNKTIIPNNKPIIPNNKPIIPNNKPIIPNNNKNNTLHFFPNLSQINDKK